MKNVLPLNQACGSGSVYCVILQIQNPAFLSVDYHQSQDELRKYLLYFFLLLIQIIQDELRSDLEKVFFRVRSIFLSVLNPDPQPCLKPLLVTSYMQMPKNLQCGSYLKKYFLMFMYHTFFLLVFKHVFFWLEKNIGREWYK